MSSDGGTAERLQHYLRALSQEARTLLIAELERGMLRGAEMPGCDLVLQELRRMMRDSDANAPRIGNSARLFFNAFKPFLVDDIPDHKHPGRIARASLEALWRWIQRDVVPDETKAFVETVSKAVLDNDRARVASLTHAFQDDAAHKIASALAAATEEKARRKLLVQIGTPRAEADVEILLHVLSAREALQALGERFPGHIENFADGQLDNAKAYIDFTAVRDPNIFLYALLTVRCRLTQPWQLIRLAAYAADSRAAQRVASTPYAAAVTIVLQDVERMIGELRADLRSGQGVAVAGLLKCIHDAAKGLRSELDLTMDSAWGRQLAALRSQISDLLTSEIDSVPGRVRCLLRPRPTTEIIAGSVLDEGDVAQVEAAAEFVGACRSFAAELAINEVAQRTYSELQQYLDTGTRALLDGLRHAGEADRPFRQSQVDAAVRLCGKVFGNDYASLLSKASEVASAAERKAVRA